MRANVRRTQGIPVVPDELTVRRTTVQPVAEPGAIRRGVLASLRAVLARDWLVLGSLLVLAAFVRLPGLAQRAEFDGDQGHDALTLLRFTRDGVFPLLGPPTSIGDFHHGAFYYLLLSPVAALTGTDPVALVVAIALMGVGAVALTWWLAGAIGGRVAGLVAGLLLALSPAAIDESTFIWNPNPIPLFAAGALAAAWRGHQTGRARWWALALFCAGVVFQLHVLGVVFVVPIAAFLVAELRARARAGEGETVRRIALAGLAGLGLIALLFVPLAIHELQTDFAETRRAIEYFTGGEGGPAQLDPVARLVFTAFRIVGWPFVGLVTDAPGAGAISVALAIALGAWAAFSLRGEERLAARWLAATAAWSAIALTFLAPSLQTVVAGLPNDHYHAYLDPVVVVLVSVAGVAMALPGTARRVDLAARALLSIALVFVVAVEISRFPPRVDPNGGWPAAEAAGRRIVLTTGEATFALVGLPGFKTTDGIGFPIVRAGGTLVDDPWSAGFIVVPCDRLFESVIGANCGGPAEDRAMRYLVLDGAHPLPTLMTRLEVSPRTSVSIYRP